MFCRLVFLSLLSRSRHDVLIKSFHDREAKCDSRKLFRVNRSVNCRKTRFTERIMFILTSNIYLPSWLEIDEWIKLQISKRKISQNEYLLLCIPNKTWSYFDLGRPRIPLTNNFYFSLFDFNYFLLSSLTDYLFLADPQALVGLPRFHFPCLGFHKRTLFSISSFFLQNLLIDVFFF